MRFRSLILAVALFGCMLLPGAAATTSRTATRTLVPISIGTPVTIYPGSQTDSQSPNAVFIFNDASTTLYIAFGSTGSLSDFSLYVSPGTGVSAPDGYVGPITGTWAAGALGNGARVTVFQ